MNINVKTILINMKVYINKNIYSKNCRISLRALKTLYPDGLNIQSDYQ